MAHELQAVGAAPVTRKVSSNFDAAMAKVIKDTVAKDCSDAEFHMFLEIAARYDLQPLVGEIWAAKMPGKNGGQGKVAFIVGRDGLLKVANRYSDFEGVDGDVHRKNDRFVVSRTSAGRMVEHSYGGDIEARGPIVGAWSEVHREGRKPVYFYAPMSEYVPTSEGKLKYSPWGSQESVMILKCAQSTALRLAFSITGLYSEGEMARALATPGSAPAEVSVEWGEDEAVAERLRMLVRVANEVRPGSYLPAKLQVLLGGKSDAERVEVARKIEQFILSAGGEIPEPPVDAEVVDAEAA